MTAGGAQTTFGRIAKALDEGRIGLKESVLLRAKLFYAPRLVPEESEFAPGPGEEMGRGCGLGFFMDVHRVKDLLNDDEKALLRKLSADLDVTVRSWEGAPATSPYPHMVGSHNRRGYPHLAPTIDSACSYGKSRL
jgi:hypothetical protein